MPIFKRKPRKVNVSRQKINKPISKTEALLESIGEDFLKARKSIKKATKAVPKKAKVEKVKAKGGIVPGIKKIKSIRKKRMQRIKEALGE